MRTTTTPVSGRLRSTGVCLLLALLIVGCQGQSDRLPVSGTIHDRDGEPLEGSISFLPDGGTEGPAANGSVLNGEYRFDRTNGPVPGKYRVIVTPLVDKPGMGDPVQTVEPATCEAQVARGSMTVNFDLP